MAFVKTTLGQACKIAEAFDARGIWPEAGSTVKEARDKDNCTIAYQDEDGWYAHASLVGLDFAGLAA